MMQEIVSKYPMTEWPIPPPLPRVEISPKVYVCPQVGLPLKMPTDRYDLKRVWFHYDIKSWHIDEFRRVALYNLIKRNLDHWEEWLRFDSTPKFYRIVSRLRKENDGAVIGIAGPKRSGKSILGQEVLTRVVESVPHVLFRYRDFEKHVENISDLAIGVQVDEDLKATGSESRNLVVHVNNAFETSRKAELWAVCTGVNLSFEGWGETLDLRLIPWGFNTKFQATRAAVFDKERDFLGLIVLQRKHRPDGYVFYENEAGFWGEYKARAIEYSRSVIREGGATDAVDDVMQDRHIAALKDYLKVHFVEKGKPIPDDRRCRRWYRKAKLPAKSISYMEEIILHAKDELDDEPASGAPFIPTSSKGWEGLREAFHAWLVAQKVQSKTAHYLADWYIWTGETQAKIGARYGVGVDAVNVAIRRYADIFEGKESELGILTEKWVEAHTDSLLPARGSGHKSDPDLLLHTSKGVEFAVNVKLCLEDKFRRDYTTTPEDQWSPRAVLAVIHARAPAIRLFPITSPQTYAKWDTGIPCAPEELAQRLKEMVDHE